MSLSSGFALSTTNMLSKDVGKKIFLATFSEI